MATTAAPLKPWERARGISPAPAVAVAPTTAATAMTTTTTTPPTLPPRSTAAALPLFSGFGGGGGVYGGGGGVYGSSMYGGYRPSAMYGGYGGAYGGFGGGGASAALPGPLERSFGWVHGAMEQFSRVSYLLGANFEALRNSFVSFLGLYEGLAPLLTAVQSLSLFRLARAFARRLRALAMWLLGAAQESAQQQQPASSVWSEEFGDKDTTTPKPQQQHPAPLFVRALVGAALAVGVPLLFSRAAAHFRQQQQPPSSTTQKLQQQQPQIAAVFEAAHDFGAANAGELALRRGDRVRVLDPHAAPGQQGWAEAEVAGRRGLVPLNYLSPLR